MTESESDDLCRKCGQPKKKVGSGRLTEWIKVCSCNLLDATTESPAPVIEYCKTCGKRQSEGRSGSFTQWVFRPEYCSCGQSGKVSSHLDTVTISGAQQREAGLNEPAPNQEVYADRIPVDRYSVIRELGKGSSGTVFLCRDQLLRKLVAIKSLNEIGRSSLLSFQNEAKATSKLIHSNIVSVLDFGVTEAGKPYMVLEYFNGLNLDQYIAAESPVAVRVLLEIFEQICDALIYAHQRKIFHRDLKPSNVLIVDSPGGELEVRLIDFGVAALKHINESSEEAPRADQSATLVGTPPYMSPDQASGKTYDGRSEIYSLGCVLFEALTGRPPFVGQSALETINMHAHASIPSLCDTMGDARLTEDFSMEALEKVIETCLSKDPRDRFQSVSELKDSLTAISAGLAPDAADSANQLADSRLRPAVGRKIWIAGVLLVTVIVSTGVAGLFVVVDSMLGTDSTIPEQDPKGSQLTQKREAVGNGIRLRVSGADWLAITDYDKKRALKRLKQAGQPKQIWMGAPFSKAIWRHLKDLELTGLGIDYIKLTDEDVASLAKLDSLRILVFSRVDVTDANLDKISTMKNLHTLVLQSSKVSDSGLAKLVSLPNLTKLSVGGMAQVNDDSVEVLLKIPHLKALSIGKTGITANGALRLIESGHIKGICLSGIHLTPAVFAGLRKSGIEGLGLMNTVFPEQESPEQIANMKYLQAVDLRNCASVTEQVIDLIRAKRAKNGLPPCRILYGRDPLAEDWDVMFTSKVM